MESKSSLDYLLVKTGNVIYGGFEMTTRGELVIRGIKMIIKIPLITLKIVNNVPHWKQSSIAFTPDVNEVINLISNFADKIVDEQAIAHDLVIVGTSINMRSAPDYITIVTPICSFSMISDIVSKATLSDAMKTLCKVCAELPLYSNIVPYYREPHVG